MSVAAQQQYCASLSAQLAVKSNEFADITQRLVASEHRLRDMIAQQEAEAKLATTQEQAVSDAKVGIATNNYAQVVTAAKKINDLHADALFELACDKPEALRALLDSCRRQCDQPCIDLFVQESSNPQLAALIQQTEAKPAKKQKRAAKEDHDDEEDQATEAPPPQRLASARAGQIQPRQAKKQRKASKHWQE